MTELPDWARRLDLAPHPEGGWFRETWRSELTVPQSALPPDYTGPRSAGTAILFLLMPDQQSAWHTVRSAEMWLYHSGGPLLLEVGAEQDTATTHLLGADILAGEIPRSSSHRATGSAPALVTTNPASSAAWWSRVSTSPISRSARLLTEQRYCGGHQSRRFPTVSSRPAAGPCPPDRFASAGRACPRVPVAANNFRRGRAAVPAQASPPPSPG